MVQHRTILKVADNSGAKALEVIHIFGGSTRKYGYIGDVLNCVVKGATSIGTRIFGPIAREVKDRGFSKIASMAIEVI